MLAIKKARKLIEDKPNDEASQVLAGLVHALENEQPFLLARLYELDAKRFDLAQEIMTEWRLDQHFSSKARARLVQVSRQMMTEVADEVPAQATADVPASPPAEPTSESK